MAYLRQRRSRTYNRFGYSSIIPDTPHTCNLFRILSHFSPQNSRTAPQRQYCGIQPFSSCGAKKPACSRRLATMYVLSYVMSPIPDILAANISVPSLSLLSLSTTPYLLVVRRQPVQYRCNLRSHEEPRHILHLLFSNTPIQVLSPSSYTMHFHGHLCSRQKR